VKKNESHKLDQGEPSKSLSKKEQGEEGRRTVKKKFNKNEPKRGRGKVATAGKDMGRERKGRKKRAVLSSPTRGSFSRNRGNPGT